MDTSFIHADIFFVITSVAVVLVTIASVVAIILLIKVLKNLLSVSKKVESETDSILEDIHHLRGNIKKEGFKLLHLTSFFRHIFKKSKKHSSYHSENDRHNHQAGQR
jgi:hypothetical protein